MRASYRASGGLARARDLALMLEEGRRSYLMSLEKLIASGTVFGFDWRGSFWVPMFQFELADLSLKPGPRLVSAELAPALDGWLKALWFVRPCGGLAARKPIEVMESNHAAVLDAARDCRMSAHAAAAGAQLSVPTG